MILHHMVDRIAQVGTPVSSSVKRLTGALNKLVGEGGSGDLVELVYHCEEVLRRSVGNCMVCNSVDLSVCQSVSHCSCRWCSYGLTC